MNGVYRTAVALIFAAQIGSISAAPPEDGSKRLGFLEAGKDYVIRFSEGNNLFKTSRAEITEATYKTAEGETKSAGPVTWNITLSVTVFQVVRFGGESWVLLRHPTNVDDFGRWAEQRRAKAVLEGLQAGSAPKSITPERLTALQAAEEVEIPTSETWINLNHAVAIASVPTEDTDLKLSVKSITTSPKP